MNKNFNETEKKCGGRREFLVRASAMAGGLVLNLANVNPILARTEMSAPANETFVKLDEKSPLTKVGGSQTVETAAGKVVIARTGETTFAAISAVCTHKGGSLNYDEKTQVFVCSSHNSKFNSDGSVVKGPAKTPVKSFKPQNALVLTGE